MTAQRHLHEGDQLAWVQQEPDAALKEYRRALELDPTLAQAYWRIGQVHFFVSPPRIDDAITAFREAVRVAPQWSEAHYWLGIGLAQNKQYETAIVEYQRAIALSEKQDERLFISLGQCLYDAGRYPQAVKAYREGIGVARHEEAGYCLMLGDALYANRQTNRACEQWKRALSLGAQHHEVELAEEARQKLRTHCGD
jgi:tetratricopeptide (TPR) repeat protein